MELRLDANRGVWERFNIMLLSNSIILLGVVTALTAPQPIAVAGLLLSLFGVLNNWLWLTRIRRARHQVTQYGDAFVRLERCLPGVTTFADARAENRKRRNTAWSTWLKSTWVDKIGATELTVLPLVAIYVYLALAALDQLGMWSLRSIVADLQRLLTFLAG